MTYIAPTARRRGRRIPKQRSQQALGGILDVLLPGPASILDYFRKTSSDAGTSVDCIAEANTKTADMDARWYNLAKNWNPTGFYTPADVNKVLQAGMAALTAGKVNVVLSTRSTSDADMLIKQSVDEIDKQLLDAQRFVNAIGVANTQGVAVAAPDLKDWLVQSLLVASNGFMTRYALECNTTWLDQADYYVTQAYNAAVTVVGIAVDAVETVVNVASGAFDTAKFVSNYAMYGFLAAGAYLVYKHLKKKS